MVLDASVVVAGQKKSYASLHDVDQEDVDLGIDGDDVEMIEVSGARYRRRSPGPLFLSSLVASPPPTHPCIPTVLHTTSLHTHTLFYLNVCFFSS